ncbi:hypothetical protein HMPREF3196_00762 [Bifidobacterium bifidum]|uniref:Uncharacterized protein n=1 Tax=Bifidobacterium bifidum TaxID=1681 RepID=A0A133KQZ0_BIFBI|nr:hypothetical protein HMPREF3196_00762 [Bifidobacterium bifidum]
MSPAAPQNAHETRQIPVFPRHACFVRLCCFVRYPRTFLIENRSLSGWR